MKILYGKNRYDLKQGDTVVHVDTMQVYTVKRLWTTGKVDLVDTHGNRSATRISNLIPHSERSVGVS